MEIREVGVYLQDPIWLNENDGPNEEPAPPLGQEGLDLHPCDDIVQAPGSVQKDSCDGQPPSIDR